MGYVICSNPSSGRFFLYLGSEISGKQVIDALRNICFKLVRFRGKKRIPMKLIWVPCDLVSAYGWLQIPGCSGWMMPDCRIGFETVSLLVIA